jgi:hypothetical protein
VFGRKTPGCPRCDELLHGAAPVVWSSTTRRQDDARRSAEIREHFALYSHNLGVCGRTGRVCTFGEW